MKVKATAKKPGSVPRIGDERRDADASGVADMKRAQALCKEEPCLESVADDGSIAADVKKFRIGWLNATLDAKHRLNIQNVSPREAAMLLCRLNPDKEKHPEQVTTDETTPEDYLRLLRAFEDEQASDAKHRTLIEWRDVARERELKFHGWIDWYLDATGIQGNASFKQPNAENEPPWINNLTVISAFALAYKTQAYWIGVTSKKCPKAFRQSKRGGKVGGRSAEYNPVKLAEALRDNQNYRVSVKDLNKVFDFLEKYDAELAGWKEQWQRVNIPKFPCA